MDKKLAFTIIALIASASLFFYERSVDSVSLKFEYENWKATHGFKFNAFEDEYRFKIFLKSWEQVETHNAKIGKSYEKGINQFSGLTEEEFAAKYLHKIEPHSPKIIVKEETSVGGPAIDWQAYGAVSPVKDQGSCTASYAFSAIGAVEGASVIFSKITSIKSWSAYPYTYSKGTCKASSGEYKIKGSYSISGCAELANALMLRPVSVAVDGQNFRDYHGGVFTNCGTSLSLAVLLTGMNDSYWILKNSWGQGWGEKGYMRIPRDNYCGVCMAASYP